MANQQDNQGGNKGGNKGSSQNGNDNRGFAGMDPERQREIASQGGYAAHEKGAAHEFTSEEARRAGAKSHGGQGSQGGSQSNQGGNQSSGSGSSGQRGGSSEQHAEAGRQSHKNDNR